MNNNQKNIVKKYDDVMMETTYVWAKKSKCTKRKVAAVIAKENVIISIGINGTPKGYIRNAEYECEDKIKICPKCQKQYKDGMYNGKKINFCIECGEDLRSVEFILKTDHDITLHAEQNALMNAARLGHATEGATIYVSTAPCSKCALLIAQAGIKRVVYGEVYKNEDGINMLKSLKIQVEQYHQ